MNNNTLVLAAVTIASAASVVYFLKPAPSAEPEAEPGTESQTKPVDPVYEQYDDGEDSWFTPGSYAYQKTEPIIEGFRRRWREYFGN
jgi:hypothetical protein